MPGLGKIEEFDPASTHINRYLERLEQYFIANGVPADSSERFKRKAILIFVIGSKAFDVLSDLCSPEAPSEKTYGDLATILKGHFDPKKLLIAERYRFHNCIQREEESASTFVANLKRLASTCNFDLQLRLRPILRLPHQQPLAELGSLGSRLHCAAKQIAHQRCYGSQTPVEMAFLSSTDR